MSTVTRFLCRIGWHGRIVWTGFDGASIHAHCLRCGKRGMLDSNGDLFS